MKPRRIIPCFLLVCLLELIDQAFCGTISAYGRKPIELSVNNAGEISSYIFQFKTVTNLLLGDGLLIEFPAQITVDTTLLTGTYVSGKHLNLKTNLWEALSGDLNISYISASRFFLIIVPDMESGIYKIQIDNIQNPNSQIGTGMFSIQTRRFAAYKLHFNLLDINDAFGQVGIIAAAPTTISITSVVLTDTQINATSDYTITLTTTIDAPADGYMVVSFEKTKISFQTDTVFSISGVTATLTRSSNQKLIISGYSTITAPKTIILTLTKLLNPPAKGFTNKLVVQTWINGANTILETGSMNLETLITYGTFTAVQKTAFQLLFPDAPSYPFVTSETIQHELAFMTSNAIPLGGQIQINYFITPPSTPTMFSMRVLTGLQDVSSTQPVLISLSGTTIVITQFQGISSGKLIKIAFEVANGSTTPLSTFSVFSYYTTATTYLIDVLDSAVTPQSLSIGTSPISGSSTVVFSGQQGGATNTVTITINQSVPSTSELWVWFPKGFVINRTTSCGTTSPSVTACDTVAVAGYGNIAIINPSAAVASPITIKIDVINGVYPFPYYPIGVSIAVTSTKTIQNHSTLYYTSGAAPGITQKVASFGVSRLSLDCEQYTMTKIFFLPDQIIPQSQWLADYTQTTSRIVIKFPGYDGTPVVAYAADLGVQKSYKLSSFPCYGILGINPLTSNDDLLCAVTTAPTSISVTVPIQVQITNYKAIASGSWVEIDFPDFKNPSLTLGVLQIILEVYITELRQEYLVYREPITLSICNSSTASENPSNGSNPAPVFNPATVSSASTTSVFYTPGTNKGLVSGNFLVFQFPMLQTTTPMQYILPKTGLKCYIGVGSTVAIPCKTYPKAGWILFNVNSVITQLVEYVFYFTGITNPTFASDFEGVLVTKSIAGNMIIETGTFLTFTAFSSGKLVSNKVTCEYFESLRTNVNFDFLFSFQHDIPANGNIDLIFPPNFYDLARDTSTDSNIPLAQIEVFFGLESYNSLPLIDSTHWSVSVNIYTIKGVKAVSAGTLIYLRMKHIRNPSSTGITNYFGIKSKTQEDLTIDYNRSVRYLTILRKLPTGIINYNYFTVSPDNGNPTSPTSTEVTNFPGTYTVSFYPNYDVPPLGLINLQFPNDFSKTYFLDSNIRCNVSGAIKTYKDCTLDTSGTYPVVLIKLDDYLYVVDGMDPVVISIPHVKNIGPELSTGVVVVKTIYDEITLDESGTTVTNRKATTGVSAIILSVSSFTYAPLNEGQAATYTVVLYPNYSFDGNTWILFEFSYDYSSNLGDSVSCASSDLQKSANSPIQCTVGNWQIQMKNLKAFTSTASTTITIQLIGIINPPAGIQPSVKCFIMLTDSHAYSYSSNIAASASVTIAAPAILFMQNLVIGTGNTRVLTTYAFTLLLGAAASFDITNISFQDGYDITNLWTTQSLTFSPAGAATVPITISNNLIQITYTTTLAASTTIQINMNNTPNPYDEGVQPGYPTVSLYSSSTLKIVQQTFNNLNNFLTPSFAHSGPLITVNNDNPKIFVEAGVWSSQITVSIAAAEAVSLSISPIIAAMYASTVQFESIVIPAGSTSTVFRIGVSNTISIQQLFIQWDKTGAPATYLNVRPIFLKFQTNKDVKVTVDTIDTVPSGGRSSPIAVTIANAPFENLYVNIRILGSIPKYLTVYPTKLTFNYLTNVDYFWVSVGPYTTGTSGKVVFFLTADGATTAAQLLTTSTFQLSPRLQTFVIAKPDSSTPLVYYTNHVVTNTGFSLQIQVSSQATIYVFAALKNSARILLAYVKEKIYPTDYFGSPYVLTEYTTKTTDYTYAFTITGLPSGFEFIAHIYVEDYNGNQSSGNLNFTDKTLGGTSTGSVGLTQSQLLWINNSTDPAIGQISSNYAYIKNIGLKFAGKIYAVVLTNPRYTYPNLETAYAGSVRYLSTALHTCSLQSFNTLSVACTLNSVSSPDPTRTDYLTYESPSTPTAYQIFKGLDEDNLFPNVVVSAVFPVDVPWVLRLSGLQPSTSYTVFYVGVAVSGANYLTMTDDKIRSISFTTPSDALVETYAQNISPIINILVIICFFILSA